MKKTSNFCLSILAAILIFSSCVPLEKQVYLQGNHYDKKTKEFYNLTSLLETDREYRLQADDVLALEISSLTANEYNFFYNKQNNINERDPILTGYLINEQGRVTLPVVGDVEVRGLTLTEAQDRIKTLLSEYLESPTVYVRLVNFRFTVLGEVNRQGSFLVSDPKMNVLEAVGMAEGLNQYANREVVQVVRSENGTSSINYVNLLDENLISSPYYYLQPNDIIVVSPLKTKNFRQNQSSNIALILSGLATAATIAIAYDRFAE